MTEWLFSGILLIDIARVWGLVFLSLLFLGIPVWMLLSKLHWRRKDAEEMARLLDRIGLADVKNTAPVTEAEVTS